MPTRRWRTAIWCKFWKWCDPFVLGPTLLAQRNHRHQPVRQQHAPRQSHSIANLAQNYLRLKRLPPLLLANRRPRISAGVLPQQRSNFPGSAHYAIGTQSIRTATHSMPRGPKARKSSQLSPSGTNRRLRIPVGILPNSAPAYQGQQTTP
jgi:hypothetical protein